MILRLRVEHMKDATGEKKRVLFATVTTDILGMESISAVSELDEISILGQELTKLINDMLALKQADIKKNNPKYKKKK